MPLTNNPAHANDSAFLSSYFEQMQACLALAPQMVTDLIAIKERWLATAATGNKVIFVGNGGSSGIASHLATDLSKNGGIRAETYSDAALITCLANDYGFEDWLAHAIRLYADKGDTLVAISSSGKSKNILNAVQQAKKQGLSVVTFSGMDADNPLRKSGDINLWVNSHAYNIIESVHQFWGMAALDLAIGEAVYSAQRVTSLRG